MRKLVGGLAIVLVLALVALLVAPNFIDLNRFKGEIVDKIRERTGRSIELAGPIGLSLLPGPAITARDVRLGNAPGAAVPDMVKVRAFEVKLAFLPLLSGRIEVRSATMVDPDIDLETLPGGGVNWRFHKQSVPESAEQATPSIPSPSRRPPSLAIDRLDIQDGTITYRGGGGIERFEHINATVRLGSPSGPFHVEGDLFAHGAALHLMADAGDFTAEDLPLHLAVTAKPSAQLELDATLSGAPHDRHLDGNVKLTASDATAMIAIFARTPLSSSLAQPLSLTGRLAGSSQAITLDQLAIQFGPVRAAGSLRVASGQPYSVDLNLAVNRLDLDRWAPARRAETGPRSITLFPNAFAAAPETALPSPADGPPLTPAIALPKNIRANLDLRVEAIVWRGDLVRQARLEAGLDDGRLTIRRAAALLPGSSDIAANATMTSTAAGARFDGTLEANADDLRSLMAWLGADLEAVPPDRLRKAMVSSRFSLAGERLEVSAIDAVLDTTHVTGAAVVALQHRLGIGLRLNADRFNLDAYLPKSAALPASPTRGAVVPVADAPAGSTVGDILGAFDANLDAHIDALTWRGQALRDTRLAGTLQNGELAIHELSVGDIAGTAGKLSGVISGLGSFGASSGEGLKAQLAFDMHGSELERLIRMAAPGAVAGRTFGAFSLGGGLQTSGENLAIDCDGQLFGGTAHVTGDVKPTALAADLSLALDHPSFMRLVRNFSPGYLPNGGDAGSFKLDAHVKGDLDRLDIDRLSLAIGQSTLDGTAAATFSARPHISADLKIGDWDVRRLMPTTQTAWLEDGAPRSRLLPGVQLAQASNIPSATRASPMPADHWSRQPFDTALLRLVDLDLKVTGHGLAYGKWRLDQPEAAVILKGGVLDVSRLAGGLFGGNAEISANLDATAVPSLRIKAALRDADLKDALVDAAGVNIVTGKFDIDATLAGTGQSEADLVEHVDGDGMIKGHDGSVSGVNLKAIDDQLKAPGQSLDLLGLIRGGAGGRTVFSALDGTFRVQKGVATSTDLRLLADGGTGQATITLDLPKWTIDSRVEFRLADVANAPPLVMHFDGPIDQPRKIFEINAIEKFLGERVIEKLVKPFQAPNTDAAQTSSPEKPSKVLRDMLKGLVPHQ